MKTEGNEPISPCEAHIKTGACIGIVNYTGLTKREHFAAMAMQGYRNSQPDKTSGYIAIQAVQDAEALIQALNDERK